MVRGKLCLDHWTIRHRRNLDHICCCSVQCDPDGSQRVSSSTINVTCSANIWDSAVGADLHIPFPIAARAAFGYWLSYFCIVSRGILALFWFGVQSAYGGKCVTVIITSIWPSFAHLSNQLPASAGITTQGMISYCVYCIIQFPFLLVPTHKLQYLFYAKSVLVLPTAFAMIIWITVKAGHSSGDFFNQPPEVHGSERAWLWLSAMTSITGGFSTLAVNIMDFSRFAKKPGSQLWQLPMIPLFKTVVAVFGVVAAAAAKKIYGEILWSPLDIIMKWQDSPGGRAAAFFAGSVWFLSQIATNISANSISFGNGTGAYLNLS
jgi:NCS1 family nucleobase:cation symporter-1